MTDSNLFLIDSHCHLDLEQFDGDREEVVTRAQAAGVRVIVNPGIDVHHSRQSIALAERYQTPGRHAEVYAAVGVHPNSSGDFSVETVKALRGLAAHPRVVAIGEIGLDYYWDKVEPEQQKRALRASTCVGRRAGSAGDYPQPRVRRRTWLRSCAGGCTATHFGTRRWRNVPLQACCTRLAEMRVWRRRRTSGALRLAWAGR